jgi:putative ABC transport system permease protein
MTRPIDIFWLALRNLTRSRLRSILTMIGIFIGIAAVVSLVSVSQGLKDSIKEQFDKIGADKLFISVKNSNFGMFSDISSAQLSTADTDVVRKVSGVDVATGMLYKVAKVRVGNEESIRFMIIIPDDAEERELVIQANTLEIEKGTMLDKDEHSQVLVGSDLAKAGTFQQQIGVGKKIEVEGRVFRTAGVLKKVGDPGTDGGVFMSENVARELFNEPTLVTTIFASTSPGEDPRQIADSVERKLRSFRNVEKGQEDFEIQTPEDILAALGTILTVIQVVLVGISVISLIVGGIGIMNTMYTSVLERTTEIGTLKAIGARNSDVLAIFVTEAGLLGIVGGIVGIILGAGIAQLISQIATVALGASYLKIFFPWYLIAGTLAFAFVIGALAGALPAYQASKLVPVEALRYE